VLSKQTRDNLADYQHHYHTHGWVRMDNYFDLDTIVQCSELLQQVAGDVQKWQLVTLVQGQAFKAKVNNYLSQPPQVRSHFIAELLRFAQQNEFQYFYEFIRLISEKDNAPELLEPMAQLIGSDSNIQTMQQISAQQSISQIDAQLTGYKPGHFLKRHSDDGYKSNKKRKVAYVLSLSKDWQADWGGLLHLQDKNKRIIESFTPTYNTLILFKVPTSHLVSQVTNYCPQTRFSISGWLWE